MINVCVKFRLNSSSPTKYRDIVLVTRNRC